ncbi:MAG: sugar phosphate isomerase/epimerase family protein [Vicinamibacteria bacterium]
MTDRRGFLTGLVACGLAPAGLARAAGKEPEVPAIRVGYQIFGWGRYFPAAWWRGAQQVASVGFRGIEGEYTISECYLGREAEFAERMRRLGVTLTALYSTSDLERAAERYENTRKNLAAARFCASSGASVIVVGGTEARAKAPELYAAYAREASELGRRTLGEHGVRLALHPHVGSLIENRDEIARVMDASDPRAFFLAPDTGHLLAGGCDPVEVYRSYASRIVHSHLKDWAPPAAPGARGAFLPLGQGQVDFAGIVAALRALRFSGWLNVELDGRGGADALEVARASRGYVESRLGLVLGEGAA